MDEIASLINQYGFPIIAAVGVGYMVFYVWKWATEEIDPVLSKANVTLIGLIDRVRMLDNDMIRLNSKLTMVLEFRDKYEKATGQKLPVDLADIEQHLEAYTSKSKLWKQPDHHAEKVKASAKSEQPKEEPKKELKFQTKDAE